MQRSSFSVSAPATSGNLGPGFDTFAMALNLRNKLLVRSGSGQIIVRGYGEDELPTDERNVIAQAFAASAGTTIVELGVEIEAHNHIPVGRGLGSSTAATACGLIAGWEATEQEWDEDQLEAALIEFDGHAVNAAACVHGGVTLAHARPTVGEIVGGLDVIPLGAVDWLSFVTVTPDRHESPEAGRLRLPASYDRADVVSALGGTALLAAGFVGGHIELLADALHTDVLHEQLRAANCPELDDARHALAETRALGATLSGAGPTILVWCDPADVDQAQAVMELEFPDHDVRQLRCEADGAMLEG